MKLRYTSASVGTLAIAFVVIACGGEVASEGRPASGSPPGSPAASSSGNAPVGSAAPAPPATEPVRCGGRGKPVVCGPGEYCSYPTNKSGFGSCGADDSPSECAKKPTGCGDIFAPVCGCDGNDYGNACEAAAKGVSVKQIGGCSAFACGLTRCDAVTSYCSVSANGVDAASCVDLPPECRSTGGKQATCDCFQLNADPCVGCAPTCSQSPLPAGIPAFTLTSPP